MRLLGALVWRGTEQPFGESRGQRLEVRGTRTASALSERSYRAAELFFSEPGNEKPCVGGAGVGG